MEYYNIETEKGWCRCYVANGTYYPATEEDQRFLFETILSIEKIYPEGETYAHLQL